MGTYDASDNQNIQQLRGVIKDYIGTRPTKGFVSTIGDSTIDVATGNASTILHAIPVAGGTNGLSQGDTVYLIYFGNQPVALNTRSFIGGASVQGTSPHTHNGLYYTKPVIDGFLANKSDIGHNHVFKELRANIGFIGGWTIDAQGIYENHSRLSGLGYIAFGNTPSTNWGYPSWATDYGVWVGWDYGITDLAHANTPVYQNDPEGGLTSAGPKMAFYKNASNYLMWTGSALLVKSAAFQLKGDGTIISTGGTIGGWTIGATKVTSPNITLDSGNDKITVGAGLILNGASQQILVGSANPRMLIDGNAKTISTNTFQTGVAGFRLNGITGNAEFNNVTARGEFHASVFVISEQHAVGGSQIVLPAAALYADAYTQ